MDMFILAILLLSFACAVGVCKMSRGLRSRTNPAPPLSSLKWVLFFAGSRPLGFKNRAGERGARASGAFARHHLPGPTCDLPLGLFCGSGSTTPLFNPSKVASPF
eukprot:7439574-Pyramimonas_sp.AAC.1